MGDVFPELKKNQAKIKEIISEEETSFSRTLVKVNGYCMLSFAGTK
jgi:alanyl-tRNA synthetase